MIAIVKWANDLGITEPINGSWIEAIARHYGSVGNRPHIQSINESLGLSVKGPHIHSIAKHFNASDDKRPWISKMSFGGENISTPPPTPPTPPTPEPVGPSIQGLELEAGSHGASILYYIPMYKLYYYNRSAWMYTQSEMADEKILTGMKMEYYRAGSDVWQNQKIYLAHIEEGVFDTAKKKLDLSQYTLSDLTLVYEGDVATPAGNTVWADINFDTNFVYDGTKNIVILWEDMSYQYTFSSITWKSTTTTGNMGLYKSSDSLIASDADGTLYSRRPNTTFKY
jgi:hypothetical protein